MALNYTSLSALAQNLLLKGTADNIFDKSALLSMLVKNDKFQSSGDFAVKSASGGLKIQRALEGVKGASGTYEGYDALNVAPTDPFNKIEIEMRNYYAPISISGDEERQVDGYPDRAASLLGGKVQNALKTIQDRLAGDLYDGADASKEIIGLDTAIGTASYGGNGESWFQSTPDTTAHTTTNMKDSTNASYVLQLLANGYDATAVNGSRPDYVFCSQTVWDIIENVMQANGTLQIKTERGGHTGDLGFNALFWRGIPIIADNYIASGNPMYMLTSEFIEFFFHPMNNFKVSEFVRPVNQDARTAMITLTCALVVSGRRNQFRWSDLAN